MRWRFPKGGLACLLHFPNKFLFHPADDDADDDDDDDDGDDDDNGDDDEGDVYDDGGVDDDRGESQKEARPYYQIMPINPSQKVYESLKRGGGWQQLKYVWLQFPLRFRFSWTPVYGMILDECDICSNWLI